MSTVTLGSGNVSIKVSPIGYGAMGLTAAYGDKIVPEDQALELLRRAFDLGVRHFDTAQAYRREKPDEPGAFHYNEELLGKFLKSLSDEERKDVTVATKYFPMFLFSTDPGQQKWSKEQFIEDTKASLVRLGVDCLDLYYFHRAIPSKIAKVEEWMGAAKELVDQGVIKRIGLSEAPLNVIKEAHQIYPITCVQQEWSLFARDLEDDLVPLCQELGIGIVAYSPIGRGFLAGRFGEQSGAPKDWRVQVPYLQEENFKKNLALLEEIKEMATSKNCTAGQLCLAWVMAKGAVPIPGTTKIKHLEDNMGTLQVELAKDEIERLDEIGNKVSGLRGNEQYMSLSYKTDN